MAGPRTASVTVREELCIESRPDPCGVAIFGASGDLSHRKLIPSPYHLFRRGLMPESFYLLGCLSYGDSPAADPAFQEAVAATLARDAPGGDADGRRAFAGRCAYQPGDYQDPELFRSLTLHLDYRPVCGVEPPEAYERLLLDCMLGDQTLFVRTDGMEAGWTLLNPILEGWRAATHCGSHCGLNTYPAGSWGPEAADALVGADGRAWRTP